jgi:DNA gyrase subunit A
VRHNGLRAIGLDEGDEIRGVSLTEGSDQVMIATRGGRVIRIEESTIRAMSRTAHGVKAIKLREGDEVVSMARVRENAAVLTVTEKGLGRRVSLEEYRIQRRGGYGLLNYKVNEKRGNVCGIKIVDEDDDIIMIATDGVIIRLRAGDIRVMGRYSGGVKLMRVKDGDRVVAFTRTQREPDEEVQYAAVDESEIDEGVVEADELEDLPPDED